MPDITHGATFDYHALGFKHRVGEPEFKHLFRGVEGHPSNHVLTLGRQRKFYSPIHKHNFEQVRFAYRGSFSIGENVTIEQGEVAYHPEGVEYGPQNDEEDGTDHVLLVLQFGGVSGQGYVSLERLREVQGLLGERGRFEGGRFFANGAEKGIDGYQATWEECNKGRKLVYPKPKYARPVLMRAGNFEWEVVKGNGEGMVERKFLGSFTERATTVEMLRVSGNGMFEVKAANAIQFLFVYEGSGVVDGEKLEVESAVRLSPGEGATLCSSSSMEVLHLIVPMLEEWTQLSRD